MATHPYIPNSEPSTKKEMLERIGVRSSEQLFESIPDRIKLKLGLKLPAPKSEYDVRRHIESLLSGNSTSAELLTFVGAGCWPHYVPAVCDEINSRAEFLTAYAGDVYTDLGRYQALFEFQSMIGELVAMDAVSFPWYDWGCVASDAIRMALALTGRNKVVVPRNISPDRFSVLRTFCQDQAEITKVENDSASGQLSLEDLEDKVSAKTAAVYVENPTYLGVIESQVNEIAKIAHDAGALFIVGVEPLSLGLVTPPGEYGADIVCGQGQPLGLHMYYGGATLGFLACRDDERLVSLVPHRLISITTTERRNEWAFTYVLPERTMFAARERAKSLTGTATALWAITAAVYMSLLGPQGFRDIALTIMERSHYAMKVLSRVKGLEVPAFNGVHFEEFTVNFDAAGKSVSEINHGLLEAGITGGKDLSKEFPELGQTALLCVTEIHTKADIDRLAASLEEIIG